MPVYPVARHLSPWNRNLWYWEIDEVREFVRENGVDTARLESEGLKEAARLIRNRPNLGHEEVHYFALQKQIERDAKYGTKMWHMQCKPVEQ
jgi:hypothetical protein